MASISSPVFVEPRLTELHTISVTLSAFGIERIRFSSALVIPFDTRAEYPPIKFIPTFLAASSRVFAIVTKSSGVLHAAAPIKAIGVTEILLFTIGIPNSFSISLPVDTRFSARVVILLYIFSLSLSRSLSMQSNKLIPRVIVLTSRFSFSIISLVSNTSRISNMFFSPIFYAFLQIFLLSEV